MSVMPFYNGTIRSAVTAFGALFNNIHIIRREVNSVYGKAKQDIKVPIAFSNRQKFFQMIDADPTRTNLTKITLPRMAYEIAGLVYDSTRKSTRSGTITCTQTVESGTHTSRVYTPSPWNLELSLFVVGNNNEDVWQIIEQILPTFNSDYTVKIKTLNELETIMTVPISLTGISIQDDYQGEMASDRLVVYTLSFIVKLSLFGGVDSLNNKVILEADFNIANLSGDIEETYHYDTSILDEEEISPEDETTAEEKLSSQDGTAKPTYRHLPTFPGQRTKNVQ